MGTLAEELSDYTLSVDYRDLGEHVVLEASKRVIDTIGCAMGAFGESPIRAARRTAMESRPGTGSTILGTSVRTSPDVATFVNGGMMRYFDFNDTYLSKEPGHPSDNIAACLATAESEGSTGRELLTSIAVAYEIQCRLCDAADIRHRGWDHVCYGLVSSALASGRLMGLSRAQLTNAVNIALNGHIAMRQVRAGKISSWKGFSFSNAARNAVFSAMLARNGMTGPSPIFEGEMGFFKQVSGPFKVDVEKFGGRTGTFKLVETYIKYFPAEYHAQSAIWAALAARKGVRRFEDIEAVEVDTHEAGLSILASGDEKWAPTTKETADHSMPYMVGMAILKGRIDNSTYSERNLRDPATLEFLRKITVREDARLSRAYPERIANRVSIRLRGGTSITERVDLPKGHPKNPMSEAEIESKFRRLTAKYLSDSQVRKILEFAWKLGSQRSLDPLLQLCVVD